MHAQSWISWEYVYESCRIASGLCRASASSPIAPVHRWLLDCIDAVVSRSVVHIAVGMLVHMYITLVMHDECRHTPHCALQG